MLNEYGSTFVAGQRGLLTYFWFPIPKSLSGLLVPKTKWRLSIVQVRNRHI